MNTPLKELLSELEQFGRSNDAANADYPRRMLNITRDTGEFLAVLVRAANARRVIEIGTSNVYSTLWLAQAALAVDGHVTTIEVADIKVGMAARNFERSGLSRLITQLHGEAGGLIRRMADSSFDMIFLDSERSEYVGWWVDLRRIYATEDFSLWTMPSRMRTKWHLLSPWYPQSPSSPHALCRLAMVSFLHPEDLVCDDTQPIIQP